MGARLEEGEREGVVEVLWDTVALGGREGVRKGVAEAPVVALPLGEALGEGEAEGEAKSEAEGALALGEAVLKLKVGRAVGLPFPGLALGDCVEEWLREGLPLALAQWDCEEQAEVVAVGQWEGDTVDEGKLLVEMLGEALRVPVP